LEQEIKKKSTPAASLPHTKSQNQEKRNNYCVAEILGKFPFSLIHRVSINHSFMASSAIFNFLPSSSLSSLSFRNSRTQTPNFYKPLIVKASTSVDYSSSSLAGTSTKVRLKIHTLFPNHWFLLVSKLKRILRNFSLFFFTVKQHIYTTTVPGKKITNYTAG